MICLVNGRIASEPPHIIGAIMAGTVRVDAAALRAAVGDDRYWQAAHPEHGAWRSWVTDGFKALYNEGRAEGGVVHVRAYMRDGHMVSAHTRSAPPRREITEQQGAGTSGSNPDREPSDLSPASASPLGMRRSLLEAQDVTPVARRPDQRRTPSGEIPTPIDGMRGGPPGAGPGSRGGQPTSRAPAAPPAVSSRSQELVDMVAPNGSPIGTVIGEARQTVRTLLGGDEAARGMFRRLTEGRSPVVIVPSTPKLRVVRLDDGSAITYRPISKSGPAAVDINIPGFSGIKRLYFID